MKIKKIIESYWAHGRVLMALSTCALLAATITYVLFIQTQQILKQRLQERITAIVSTIANEISAVDVESVKDVTDLNTPQLEKLVKQLERLRLANANIQYAYIMRRTKESNILEFVADADSLDSIAELDLNEDGEVSEDEVAPLPGDPFDISAYPTLRDEAFYHPVAANELEQDQWSVQLSAYAPILDESGNAVAIVGIDVIMDDFNERTQAMLRPFLLFILFLILLLSLLTVTLVRVYNERVEAVKELDRQKDELLGIVSHQLATPISALKWDFEMLLDGDIGTFTGEQKDFFQKLQGVAAHLSDLVSMILDVSRIQLGRMKVDRTDLELNTFFDELLNIMSAKAKERNVNLTSSIPKGLRTAQLDKRLMLMITENLMSNAIKYTPEKGNVKLDVKVENKVLKIVVSDTGCGIPKQDQDKIFGKLYRASNVRSVDGNGFGLYVVKGATEAQGGKITFKSQENQGTSFYVELPLKENQETK
ncbi:hypothetical protein A3C37_02905 [Candidatus Peribacteria bacterium RIFCSPHIGHO2_02_FULL_53_20]|nr:MAG: hypothetical protein A3C37_02905 [Candidatus Peribacteria bacterium RIFCSPHIGHO2_02_FULL_53_20]